jgi:hypothetical protein
MSLSVRADRALRRELQSRGSHGVRYLTCEIEQLSAELDSLEAEDLEAKERHTMLRLRQGSTSRRQAIPDPDVPDLQASPPSRVKDFIKEQESRATNRWKVSDPRPRVGRHRAQLIRLSAPRSVNRFTKFCADSMFVKQKLQHALTLGRKPDSRKLGARGLKLCAR